MKKRIASTAAALLVSALVLAGCSNNNNTDIGVATDEAISDIGDKISAASAADTPMTTSKQEYFSLVSSTSAGNSGNVTIEPGDTYAVISIRGYGDLKIKLYPELAPYAVHNFVEIAKKGDYNGRNFHRVMENFMMQGGSPGGNGKGGECIDGGNFKNQINTSLRHYYGALCYASTSTGNISDGFYIVNSTTPQDNLESIYDKVSESFGQNVVLGSIYLNGTDESAPEYSTYKDYYEYNSCAVEGITAMKATLTDAVKNTYKEKGGTPILDGCYTVFGQTVEGFDIIDKIAVIDKVDDGYGNITKPASDIIIDKVEIFTA